MSSRFRYIPLIDQLEERLTPAIRLDLVTLHELGHALGLAHTNNVGSIMDPYYNANYNLNNFGNDPAVTTFRNLFSNVSTSSWKDTLDANPGNGRVEITYSYMPDGSKAEQNKDNQLFAKFNAIFGNAATWQNVIAGELNRWASVSNNKVSFSQVADNGLKFGSSGAAQNDSRFGDIRIAAHRFDGSGKTLAHTYYPPPNGGTAAGDMHFDFAEAWVLASGQAPLPFGSGGGASGNSSLGFDEFYFCDFGSEHDHDHDHGSDEMHTGPDSGEVSIALAMTSASTRVTDLVFQAAPIQANPDTETTPVTTTPAASPVTSSTSDATVSQSDQHTDDQDSPELPLNAFALKLSL